MLHVGLFPLAFKVQKLPHEAEYLKVSRTPFAIFRLIVIIAFMFIHFCHLMKYLDFISFDSNIQRMSVDLFAAIVFQLFCGGIVNFNASKMIEYPR